MAHAAFVAAQKVGQSDAQAEAAAATAVRAQVGPEMEALVSRLAMASKQANSVDCAYDTANCPEPDCDAKTGKCARCINKVQQQPAGKGWRGFLFRESAPPTGPVGADVSSCCKPLPLSRPRRWCCRRAAAGRIAQ